MKKATYFALDIICAAACYYFAGWHGLIAYAAVWVAGFGITGITVTVHLTFSRFRLASDLTSFS